MWVQAHREFESHSLRTVGTRLQRESLILRTSPLLALYGICSTMFIENLDMRIEVIQLIWDEINAEHIWNKHKIGKEEVEQAVANDEAIARLLPNGRVLMLGLTEKDRLLSLILSPKDTSQKVWYPVTARVASKSERKLYSLEKGDTK